jgi:CDGSH-type Zn-finger protein
MNGDGARITPYRDGPLLVRGTFTLTDQDGRDIDVPGSTVALCRCGRSRQKPFCDGMHKAVDWRAPSEAQRPHAEDAEPPAARASPVRHPGDLASNRSNARAVGR